MLNPYAWLFCFIVNMQILVPDNFLRRKSPLLQSDVWPTVQQEVIRRQKSIASFFENSWNKQKEELWEDFWQNKKGTDSVS